MSAVHAIVCPACGKVLTNVVQIAEREPAPRPPAPHPKPEPDSIDRELALEIRDEMVAALERLRQATDERDAEKEDDHVG